MSAPDQVRREILARHRRNKKVCGGCGQWWPCTQIAAVAGDLTRFAGRVRLLKAVGVIVAVLLLLAAGEALVAWAWLAAQR